MRDEGFVYVDVRTAAELVAGFPEGARHVPLDDAFVATMQATFARDQKLVVGCAAGVRSLRAVAQLVDAGFTHVVDQRAGFLGVKDAFGRTLEPGWSACGLPVSYALDATES